MRKRTETSYSSFNPETGKVEPCYTSPIYLIGDASVYLILPMSNKKPRVNPDRHTLVRLRHFMGAETRMRMRAYFRGEHGKSDAMIDHHYDYTLARINTLYSK